MWKVIIFIFEHQYFWIENYYHFDLPKKGVPPRGARVLFQAIYVRDDSFFSLAISFFKIDPFLQSQLFSIALFRQLTEQGFRKGVYLSLIHYFRRLKPVSFHKYRHTLNTHSLSGNTKKIELLLRPNLNYNNYGSTSNQLKAVEF